MMNKYILIALIAIAIFGIETTALGQQYNIKEMTPAVEQALEGRKARFEKLNQLKAQGVIGENNKGYVENLAGDDDTQAVVNAENKDRKVIYITIADQNGLTDSLHTIEKVFAQVKRDKAKTGEKIQLLDGSWTSK